MKWISVEDRLPENRFAPFLVALSNGMVTELNYNCFSKKWFHLYEDIDFEAINPVQHWMELPKPPKTD